MQSTFSNVYRRTFLTPASSSPAGKCLVSAASKGRCPVCDWTLPRTIYVCLLLLPAAAKHDCKRSCSSIHLFAPCVKKAKAHLLAIGRNLKDWRQFADAREELQRSAAEQREAEEIESSLASRSTDLQWLDSLRSTGLLPAETLHMASRGQSAASARQHESLGKRTEYCSAMPGMSVLAEVELLLARLDRTQRSLVQLVSDQQGVVAKLEVAKGRMEMDRLRRLPRGIHKGELRISRPLSSEARARG